jgi:branched-chain amino acid transport system substrate-binding protein
VLLLLAAVGAFAQAGKPAAAGKISGDVVKIGVLSDMSSLYADIGGPGSIVAAQMAVDEFGGKMLGKPIQIVSSDHQNKPDVGANIARQWFDTGNVDVIVDVPNSGVALAVAKVAAEKHRLFLVSGAGSTALTNEECNPYTVHYTYDTYATGSTIGDAVVAHGGNTWFFITADYAFGHALQKDTTSAITAKGGKVLGSVLVPLNAPDFSSYLLQAQSSGAKVIGLANAGGDTIKSIKTASEFGISKKQTLAGLLVFITDIHSLGLQTSQGMYIATAFYWDMNDETRKFSKAFIAKHKAMPTMAQAGVYSSVRTYLNAIQAAGTDDPDAVMKQLHSMTINDVFVKNGKIRPDGLMVHDMYLAQVKSPAESKYPWDYYKILATVPPDTAFQPLSQSRCPLVKK